MPKTKEQLKDEIRRWISMSSELMKATHLIVFHNSFGGGDCYCYAPVHPEYDVQDIMRLTVEGTNGTHRIVEVYDLSLDIESQLAEEQAIHYSKIEGGITVSQVVTKSTIRKWLDLAKLLQVKSMVIIRDNFNQYSYPAFILNSGSVDDVVEECKASPDTKELIEVFDMSGDIEAQLNSPERIITL